MVTCSLPYDQLIGVEAGPIRLTRHKLLKILNLDHASTRGKFSILRRKAEKAGRQAELAGNSLVTCHRRCCRQKDEPSIVSTLASLPCPAATPGELCGRTNILLNVRHAMDQIPAPLEFDPYLHPLGYTLAIELLGTSNAVQSTDQATITNGDPVDKFGWELKAPAA